MTAPELDLLRSRLFPKMLSLCRKMLSNQSLAQDIAHDVWTDFVVLHATNIQAPVAVEAYIRLTAAFVWLL